VSEQKISHVQKQQTKTVTEIACRDQPLEHFAVPLRQEMIPSTEQRVRKVTKQRSEQRTGIEVVTSHMRD